MNKTSARDIVITVFVILWLVCFNYASTRFFYLEPLFRRPLPAFKYLFPPAGWVMFYSVDDRFVSVDVYGIRRGVPQRIDPHEILRTRHIGYDNIKRNVLSEVLDEGSRTPFCVFLKRKFNGFDDFAVTQVYYPSLTRAPLLREEGVVYKCSERMDSPARGRSGP